MAPILECGADATMELLKTKRVAEYRKAWSGPHKVHNSEVTTTMLARAMEDQPQLSAVPGKHTETSQTRAAPRYPRQTTQARAVPAEPEATADKATQMTTRAPAYKNHQTRLNDQA